MGYLYNPVVHRCETPASNPWAPRRVTGAWWQCDDCGALWEFSPTPYGNDWMRRRPTKRVLRKIERLTGGDS